MGFLKRGLCRGAPLYSAVRISKSRFGSGAAPIVGVVLVRAVLALIVAAVPLGGICLAASVDAGDDFGDTLAALEDVDG